MSVPHKLGQAVRSQANRRCEYCHALEVILIRLEVEHIYPEALGGETSLENLCLSCRWCNSFKGVAVEAVDPETQQVAPLFNPRTQQWAEHFAWDEAGAYLLGLTPIGRATVQQLKMNRDEVVQSRTIWKLTGLHPPQD